MFRFLIFALLLIPLPAISEVESSKRIHKQEKPLKLPVYDYEKSPFVSSDVWEYVKPYFLPSNHPLKAKLDKIFAGSRATLNQNTMLKAGFEKATIRTYSQLIVSKHPDLEGYLVKLFTDEQDLQDYPPLIWRIQGANAVRHEIDVRGYKKMFAVPNKWIYPLPAEPSPPPDYYRKNFILVVEDMHIFRKRQNYRRWKEQMTPSRADAMYILLQTVGLNDSIYPFNLPFCKDGRQAFIDTEHHHKWPIRFDLMLPFFSPRMEKYWRDIVGQGGPR